MSWFSLAANARPRSSAPSKSRYWCEDVFFGAKCRMRSEGPMNRRYIEAVVPKKLKNFIRAHRKTVAPRNFFDVYILGKHLAYIIKDRSIDLVIDVGANVGQFGSMVRERSKYKGAIISF